MEARLWDWDTSEVDSRNIVRKKHKFSAYLGRECLKQLTCARPGVQVCVWAFTSRRFPPPLPYLDKCWQPFVILNHNILPKATATNTIWQYESMWYTFICRCFCFCSYPVCMQNVQSVHERHDALLQGVQCVVLWVVVSEVVPQTAKWIPEQLNLLRLLTENKNTIL